jgi:cell division inhibitor SepF
MGGANHPVRDARRGTAAPPRGRRDAHRREAGPVRKGVGAGVAGSLWDRMLAWLGFEAEELEDEEPALAAVSLAAGGGAAGRLDGRQRRALRAARGGFAEEAAPARPNVRAATVTRISAALPGLVVVAPRRFEEAQEAADHLKAGQPVILHLEGMDRELAQRLINFLAGSVYALGGEMHRVGAVVIFAPAGVDVTLPLSLRIAERDAR